ncbi:RNA polymerase sigma factor [Rhodococcus kronopolitis]|uniref:RNA polymerase sigma factor n=1 Tax=Rhodococcus kronopolitis TaxID=1460226 RepID=A0ABV9FNS4_9NOCA
MGVDETRFTEIYMRLYSRVWSFARRRASDSGAHDATDEAFLIAWQKLHQLPEDPLPWLLVAARNVLSENRRRDDRQDALVERIVASSPNLASAEPGAEHAVVERLAVLGAMESLSARDRETLMLTAWDGLSHAQAAEVMGCSISAFGVRHHRARRRLEAALSAQDRGNARPTIRIERDAR